MTDVPSGWKPMVNRDGVHAGFYDPTTGAVRADGDLIASKKSQLDDDADEAVDQTSDVSNHRDAAQDKYLLNWLTHRHVSLALAFATGVVFAAIVGGPYEYRARGDGYQIWRLNQWTGSATVCRVIDPSYNITCSSTSKTRAKSASPAPVTSGLLTDEEFFGDPAAAPAADAANP
jgi:hypothetical protein